MVRLLNKITVLSLFFLFAANAMAQGLPEVYLQRSEPSSGVENNISANNGCRNNLLTRFFGRASNVMAKKNTVPKNASSPLATTGDGTELWGSIVYADSWNDAYWKGEYVPFGYYAFRASSNDSSFDDLALDEMLQADGGAVVLGDTLHLVHDVYGYGSHWIVYAQYDIKTWKQLTVKTLYDFGLSALDLAYDPTTGLVYGQFSSSDSGTLGFGTIDYKSLTKDVVPMDTTFVGLACNSYGQLYGINIDGGLYRIDKNTGEYTFVGSTGIVPSRYRQSATFDLSTDKLYFASQTIDNTSGLYEIDTSTGRASLIKQFDDNQEICGLFVPSKGVVPASPSRAENLSIDFQGGSLDGVVKFIAPSSLMNGNPLSGTIKYYIVANGDTLNVGTTTAGAPCNVNVSLKNIGSYRFEVITRNDSGFSQPKRLKLDWVGFDTPIITDANLAIDKASRRANVSWVVNDAGKHGGFVDKDGLLYDIMRFPDGKLVASKQKGNSFSEILPGQSTTLYSYAIVAYNHGQASDTVHTAQKILGDSYEIPYNETFSSQDVIAEAFKTIDGNDDGVTWQWNGDNGGAAAYDGDGSQQYADDWLLTPNLKMETGRKYYLSFISRGADGNRLQVKFGSGENPSDRNQYKVIVKTTELKGYADTTFHSIVDVEKNGLYRFAFHATSGPRNGKLLIDDILVEKGAANGAPDSVSNIKVEPAAKGVLAAKISFKAPAKTVDGNNLAAISMIKVHNGNRLVGSFDNVKPGDFVQVDDNNAANGVNTYTVVPFNDKGEGLKRSASAYVGLGRPSQVRNLRFADNLDGTATLSWNAPSEEGIGGGFVDSSKVEYDIYYSNYTNIAPVATLNAKQTYTVTIRKEGFQDNLYYTVRAKNIAGESADAVSPMIVEGEPYQLPFKESFPKGNFETFWWLDNATSSNSYRFNIGSSADNDGGAIYWAPSNESAYGGIRSGLIDISKASRPVLSFWHYVVPGFDGTLSVTVAPDLHGEQALWKTDYKTVTMEGWTRQTVDLSAFKGSRYIVLGFHANSTQIDGHGMFLDDIEVNDVPDHNLKLSMYQPKRVRKGAECVVRAVVSNTGSSDEREFSINLLSAGKVLATADGGTLKAGSDSVYALKFVLGSSLQSSAMLLMEVVSNIDEDKTDNVANASVVLYDNGYAAPNSVSLSAGTSYTVSWAAPDQCVPRISDDLEDYASWTVGDFGSFATADCDGQLTYGLSGLDFPHNGEPMSFLMFNPDELGIDTSSEQYASLNSHSGEQYLACFDAAGGKNDDWLMSPLLSGEQQTLSFFARSLDDKYPEQFEVLASYSGLSLDDFTPVTSEPVTTTGEWSEYSFTLPAGSKYFAVHVVSADKFALLLDDISYDAKKPVLVGYNVYRDGVLIGSVPKTTLSFTDEKVANSANAYAVSAVYDCGESRLSVADGSTGISLPSSYSDMQPEEWWNLDGAKTSNQHRGVQIVRKHNGQVVKVAHK